MAEITGLAKFNPTDQERALIRQAIAPKLSETDFELFMAAARHTGLNPLLRQIFPVVYAGRLVIQTGIDGFRLQAERSQKYEGQIGPLWCGEDGKWTDVWIKTEPPTAAKVGLLKSGCKEPFWGVAKYQSFVKFYDGKPGENWNKMPDIMLAKCAEAQAIRKAFPVETAGIYIPEEIDPDVVEQQAAQDAKNVTPHGKPKVEMPKSKAPEVKQIKEMLDEMKIPPEGREKYNAQFKSEGPQAVLKAVMDEYNLFLDKLAAAESGDGAR
jgi:phage recombination protein Bet